MFYTYMWLRPDATPYYVGKGSGDRAFIHHGHLRKPGSSALIFVQQWESEEKAFEMEIWYISFFGRKDLGTGILRNLTDGGDQPPSQRGKLHSYIRHSMETRRKISLSKLGHSTSEESRRRMSEAHMGHTHSGESRRKIGEASARRGQTEETCRKISEILKGNTRALGHRRSEETLVRMRLAQRNRRDRERVEANHGC
jgi:hypothetical protein